MNYKEFYSNEDKLWYLVDFQFQTNKVFENIPKYESL